MNVLITLTTAGADTGPFNLYSNTDSYVTAFATGIAKSVLVAGYTSTVVPTGTTTIRVKSTGTCTNYVDLVVTGTTPTTTTTTTPTPTTTTTTTAGGGTTTTTTTSIVTPTTTTTTTGEVTPTTTTTTTPTPTPTTTTTTTAVVTYYNVTNCAGGSGVAQYNGPDNLSAGVVFQSSNSNCYTVVSVGSGPATEGIVLGEYSDCSSCGGAPVPTTTTTTTLTPEWYQITNCTTLATATTAQYTVGAYSINERVEDFGENVYTITATYSTNPGGAGLFISSLGATGCPSGTTTTTTTLAPSVATNILVEAVNTSGPDQDCLGTPYPVTVTTVTATLYDQYGATMNVVGSPITVVVNATYNPCYGGSTPTTYNIVIPVGDDGASVNWDSSRTVDCGASNCILETTTYDCAFSNTASLPWRSGTISC